jgi:hypothetical protein
MIFKLAVNEPERIWLEHQARAAGMTVANYFRDKVGLHARPMGRPTAAQLEDMEDDAWSLLAPAPCGAAREAQYARSVAGRPAAMKGMAVAALSLFCEKALTNLRTAKCGGSFCSYKVEF